MASYLVVGAGVFGASTAYHLIRKHPNASVTLIDRSLRAYEAAASWDWQKVVRAEYEDKFYMGIALEAFDKWNEDAYWSRFFHRSGAVWIMDEPGYAETIVANYRSFGRELDYEIIRSDELRRRYDGIFADADLAGVGQIFVNNSSGWAEAREALNSVIDKAVCEGVKNVAFDVKRVLLNEEGRCAGVIDADGHTLHADNVVLCTGAYTARLLADSMPGKGDFQIGDRLKATGVITGLVKLDHERHQKLANAPVLVHNVGKTMGESMPPLPDGFLKINRDVSFQNTKLHPQSGTRISMPPEGPAYNEWAPPLTLEKELETVSKGIFGKLIDGLSFAQSRLCWDSITPSVDFIIAPHPECQGLYVATGGSYHGWKFLPVIGRYVVEMLSGALSKECAERWAWDKPKDGPDKGYAPERELAELEDDGPQ